MEEKMSEQKNNTLAVGEKYLSGSIGGKDGIKIALFPNKQKKKNTDPDFMGNIQIAIWVNKKGDKTK